MVIDNSDVEKANEPKIEKCNKCGRYYSPLETYEGICFRCLDQINATCRLQLLGVVLSIGVAILGISVLVCYFTK